MQHDRTFSVVPGHQIMQKFPDLNSFKLGNFIKVNKELKCLLETRAGNFLEGLEVQRDVGGGRILLGDNRTGEAVTLCPIRFQYVGVWISAQYIISHMCTQLRPTQYLASAGIFGTLLLLKTYRCFEFLNDPKFCTKLAFSISSVECSILMPDGRTDRHPVAIEWGELSFRDSVHSERGFSEDSLHG